MSAERARFAVVLYEAGESAEAFMARIANENGRPTEAGTPVASERASAPNASEEYRHTADPMEGVICDCNGTPAMCSYCRAAETDARELRILSAFYAHLRQEDEQAARVDRFRLAEGEEVWQLGDYDDEADDEPTEDDGNYWIDIDGCNRRGPEPPHA